MENPASLIPSGPRLDLRFLDERMALRKAKNHPPAPPILVDLEQKAVGAIVGGWWWWVPVASWAGLALATSDGRWMLMW